MRVHLCLNCHVISFSVSSFFLPTLFFSPLFYNFTVVVVVVFGIVIKSIVVVYTVDSNINKELKIKFIITPDCQSIYCQIQQLQ